MGACYFLQSGDFYLGEWSGDRRHGHGVQFYKNGERYEGTWVNDCREGVQDCVLDSPDKKRYVGSFSRDKKHGFGVMIYRDGTQIEELWNMDELENSGRVILASPILGVDDQNLSDKKNREGRSKAH